MLSKKDITVIIPVHKWDEDIKKMYDKAYKSIVKGPSIIVVTPTDSGFASSAEAKKVKVVESSDGSSFQHLVNLGAAAVETEWFSILEFDDEYTPIWFDNFIKYQEYNQEYNIFLPLNDLYNVEDGKNEFVGNGNEAVLAASFSEVLGVIDEASLEDYFSYYIPGGLFKTQLWKDIGGLKESIKLTFWYEFLLRAAHKGEKMYVIPKVGYIHILGRDGSLMQQYRAEIDTDESNFWFQQAKKQSYHKQDKNVVYEKGKKAEEEDVE